jgi:hypothetical protein
LPEPRLSEPLLFKIRATLRGGHYHVGIWAGTRVQRDAGSRPKLGDLIMDDHDLTSLVAQMAAGAEALGVPLDVAGDARGRSMSPAVYAERFPEPGDVTVMAAPPCSPRPSITDPSLLGLVENFYPPDPSDPAFDLVLEVAPPEHLDRVWVKVQGVMTRRSGAASWSLSVFVNDGPMAWRHSQNWGDGQNAARPGDGNWVTVDRPGETMTIRVRLDGATWLLPSPLPVSLQVTEDRPPNPYAPPPVGLTPPAEIPHPDDV